MTLDELIGSLQAYELRLDERSLKLRQNKHFCMRHPYEHLQRGREGSKGTITNFEKTI